MYGDWFAPDCNITAVILDLHIKRVIIFSDVAKFINQGLMPDTNDGYVRGRAFLNYFNSLQNRGLDLVKVMMQLQQLQKPLNKKVKGDLNSSI